LSLVTNSAFTKQITSNLPQVQSFVKVFQPRLYKNYIHQATAAIPETDAERFCNWKLRPCMQYLSIIFIGKKLKKLQRKANVVNTTSRNGIQRLPRLDRNLRNYAMLY